MSPFIVISLVRCLSSYSLSLSPHSTTATSFHDQYASGGGEATVGVLCHGDWWRHALPVRKRHTFIAPAHKIGFVASPATAKA